jgi:hypothetical protein
LIGLKGEGKNNLLVKQISLLFFYSCHRESSQSSPGKKRIETPQGSTENGAAVHDNRFGAHCKAEG